MQLDGRKMPGGPLHFRFTGKRLAMGTSVREDGGTFTPDVSVTPHRLDVDMDERTGPTGRPVRGIVQGIYKFEGRSLVICIGGGNAPPGDDPNGERPTAFTSGVGEGRRLYRLERVEQPPRKAPAGDNRPAD
jgi:uncharacterized protein (TIGR03067 family)